MAKLGWRALAAVAAAGIASLVIASPAGAHPLGNFTVNQYAGLYVAPGHGTIDYVIDRAEIPTQQLRGRVDANSDGHLSRTELAAFAAVECSDRRSGLQLGFDSHPLVLTTSHVAATAPAGQIGLPTLRVECRYSWSGAPRSGGLTFVNSNFGDRVGWREITITGDRARLTNADVASGTVSARLTAYPSARLQSPLDQRHARANYSPGGAAAVFPGATPAVKEHANPFTDWLKGVTDYLGRLVGARELTLGLALVAMAIAIGLGALHAIAPGHGKTVMAAYLVGERGSVRHGLLLGVTVAVTHTAGVLVLGVVLTASETIAPEAVLPWLAVASGLCFAGLGISLFVRARRMRQGRGWFALPVHSHGAHGHSHGGHTHGPHVEEHHDHDHVVEHDRELVLAHAHVGGERAQQATAHVHQGPVGHAHSHGDHGDHNNGHVHSHGAHEHGGHDHSHSESRGDEAVLGTRGLVTLGFAGGLVPTPSALIVLLGATAIGRAWFGAVLVVAYGVGMAATLVGAGLALAWARRRFELKTASDRALRIAAALPLVTATIVTGGGLLLIGRAIAAV